jgi:hypothetical protein
VGAAAAGLLAVLVLVVLVLPPLLGGNDRTVQNNVRTTLLQGFAALLILTGAAVGAAVTLRQVRTTREGQITDRYTRAVDQLGSQHLDVRLGGIYALERIARDSPPDRPTIEEVLTAYVRGHAPWPPHQLSRPRRRSSSGWSASRSGNVRHCNAGRGRSHTGPPLTCRLR